MDNIGNHTRGYIPHIEVKKLQFVTFRLYDSIPQEVLNYCKTLSEYMNSLQNPTDEDIRKQREMLRLIDRYEDSGMGHCFLRDPRVAQIVQDALQYYNGKSYTLLEWCIMPNHVHLLLKLADDYTLSRAIQSLKSYTAHEANKLLDRQGPFWSREYFDRYIRGNHHYKMVVGYIANNPVKAGLVNKAEEWPWRGSQGRLLV